MNHGLMFRRSSIGLACVLTLAGCASPSGIRAPLDENVAMVEGPAVEDIVTPFDRALSCLDGRLSNKLTFSVGAILDSTGKEQLAEGGVGKFVTQGAGDIVQSALFQAGATVVNRRDPRIMETETRWGLYNTKTVIPSMFFITGSINSLDFIPGGGFEVQVAGVGPRYRQHRIVVGMDLSMTETKTGRIVANIPLQKQIVASEVGFGVGRFFGDTLISLDAGKQNREAVSFALRQMLSLSTFELLTQVMKPENYADCRSEIQAVHGVINNTKTSKRVAKFMADREIAALTGASPPQAQTTEVNSKSVSPLDARPAPSEVGAIPLSGSKKFTKPIPIGISDVPQSANVGGSDKNDTIAVAPMSAQLGVVTQSVRSSTEQGFFNDELTGPSEKAVRALDIPVRSGGEVSDATGPSVLSITTVQSAPTAPEESSPIAVSTGVASSKTDTQPLPMPLRSITSVEQKPGPVVQIEQNKRVTVPAFVVAQPSAAAVNPLAAKTDVKAPVSACAIPAANVPVVQAPQVRRLGTDVYVSAPVGSTLCVVDATGKVWSHQFKTGGIRPFKGTAPWYLASPDLGKMNIFFQGWRIPAPQEGVQSIQLQERPLQ